ncbi:MAG TPA: sugar ABC transporter permease [Candidatus Limnocylindrales bacterium]|jgi:multiple sugar transport system permease protein|nr:sugar ABC transporter permease [Candidatus Limnocylindrales bacterium]
MIARRPRTRGQALLVAGFLAPSLILIAVFVVAPVVWAVVLSFTNWKLTGPNAQHPDLVGLANYGRLIGSQAFRDAFLRTVIFVFVSAIVGQFALGLASALLLHRRDVKLKSVLSAAILLPLVVPETVAAFAWASMLESGSDGTLNRVIGIAGLEPIAWLQDNAMLAIIVVNIWRGIAFAMILFSAALEGVPQDVTEAATVDGASARQLLTRITLPLIKHAIVLYMLLTTIGTVTVFGLIYFLTRGGPGGDTTVLSIFIYERAFRFFEIGLGSAASVILLGVVLGVGLLYVRLLRAQI